MHLIVDFESRPRRWYLWLSIDIKMLLLYQAFECQSQHIRHLKVKEFDKLSCSTAGRWDDYNKMYKTQSFILKIC